MRKGVGRCAIKHRAGHSPLLDRRTALRHKARQYQLKLAFGAAP